MAKRFVGKSGFSLDAHVVTEEEAPIAVATAKGQEHAAAGDAIVSLKKQQFVVPAVLFAALLEEEPAVAKEKEPASKGGQHKASETKESAKG